MTAYFGLVWIFWTSFLIMTVEPGQGDETDTKLLLVQTLFRHGARAPTELYPTDPNPPDRWPGGLEKLTLQGKKQSYGLGLLFRKMYENFITTDPKEIIVNSSSADRCIRSALSNLAAFYKPSSEWSFKDDVDWQPIPVHSTPEAKDKYLAAIIPCSRANKDTARVMRDLSKHLFSSHKEMIDNLTRILGHPLDELFDLFMLHDTLMIEKTNNLPIPPWAEHYYDELTLTVEPIFHSILTVPSAQRLRIGPLLGNIVEDMVKKSSGYIPDLKVRLYSSHDYQVGLMLKALKVYNGKRPPYSASIVFELRETSSGEKVVRLLYLNSTTPEDASQVPHILTLDGCSEYCPLDYFVSYTKDSIPENWEEECEVEDLESTDSLHIAPLSDARRTLN